MLSVALAGRNFTYNQYRCGPKKKKENNAKRMRDERKEMKKKKKADGLLGK